MTSPGAGRAAGLAERLLQAAAGEGLSDAQRLEALICCDAARWVCWPADSPAARAREAELVALPDGPALGHLFALRRALRAAGAGDFDALAAQLEALPAGYPFKSLWLHWRDLILSTGRREAWDPARERLRQRLARQGLPPSETLPALLGRLDLARWRAGRRLRAEARAALEARLEEILAGSTPESVPWYQQTVAGKVLLELGAPARGASLIYEAVHQAPLGAPPPPARLFSRPTPEAATFLRRALDRALVVRHPARDGLVQQVLLALLHLADTERLNHVLREAIEPLAIEFQRPDLSALVLARGSHAWLSCGEQWMAQDWIVAGLRTLGRYPHSPLAGATIEAISAWMRRCPDPLIWGIYRELPARLEGLTRYRAEAELAGLARHFEDDHAAWDRLTHAYRWAQNLPAEGQATVYVTIADQLLGWDHPSSALHLLRRAVDEDGAGMGGRLPANLAIGRHELAAEHDRLRAVLATDALRPNPLARTITVLLHHGETDLARAALQAACRRADGLTEPGRRTRTLFAMARQTAAGFDAELARQVATAVTDEVAAVRERLEVDDPPALETNSV